MLTSPVGYSRPPSAENDPSVKVIEFKKCEGDGDVVGFVTPLRGGAQVVLHGVQVVEVGAAQVQ